eukprot:SAG11_NODE_29423_length_311_cov_0.476415_1_plen_87_part_10
MAPWKATNYVVETPVALEGGAVVETRSGEHDPSPSKLLHAPLHAYHGLCRQHPMLRLKSGPAQSVNANAINCRPRYPLTRQRRLAPD